MTQLTKDKLETICEEICDSICRWPGICDDQQELDDKCAGCQTLVDLTNLVEGLDKHDAEQEKAG